MLTALSAVAWRRGRHEAARLLSPLAVACGRIGIKPFASSASSASASVFACERGQGQGKARKQARALFGLAAGVVALGTTSLVQLEGTSRPDPPLGTSSSQEYLTNGWLRSAVFYFYALPIYSQYKLTEWWFDGRPYQESKKYYEFLHERHCDTVEHVCLLLKGFYLKGAQVASTRDDLIPKQYLTFCKRCQDEVPTELADKTLLESTICRSLGISDIHEVFDYIDCVPIGAASIGAVHKAKLKDGRVVAVKVQYPDIETRFKNDLTTVKTFCSFALPSHVPFLEEIERQFLTEFNYVAEAENLDKIRKNVLPSWRKHIYIPYVVKELCTKDVMVMEFLQGKNLLKSVVSQYERYAAEQGLTLKQLAEKNTSERTNSGAASLASQAAKSYVAKKALQLRDLSKNGCRLLYNLTLSKVNGTSLQYQWSEYPINLARVLEILMHVHAYEIFRNGVFNADPHPGNIMLLEDGRIGLIDYGQVKEMPLDKRLKFAQLIVYLATNKDKSVVQHATTKMGLRTKNMNHDMIYKILAFFNDRDTDDITGGRNIQQFLDWQNAVDPITTLDDSYVMVGRVAILLRALGNAFNLKLRVSPYWRSEAQKLLDKHS